VSLLFSLSLPLLLGAYDDHDDHDDDDDDG